MEEKNNQEEKEMTIGDLAQIATKGFEKVNKRFDQSDESIDKKIEKLATNIQNEFLALNSSVETINTNIKNNKAEIHKKADTIIHNELVYRVEKLEKKFA